jgi:hypothetical protein
MNMDDLKRDKDALFKRYPELKDVRVLPLGNTAWSYRNLSAFIEQCFSHDCGDESRILFTPEFLEWNMPAPLGVCVLDDRNRWLGCVLSFSYDYCRDGEIKKYTIGTAICTIPEMRGRGLGQLLGLSSTEFELTSGSGSEFSLSWVDNRYSHEGNSRLVLRQLEKTFTIRSFDLICKPVDCRKARIYAGLNTVTYAAARAAQLVFPSRRGNRFPAGFRVAPFRTASIDGYLALFDAVDRFKRFRRAYDPEGLARLLNFHKNGFHTLSYSLDDGGGTPWALLHGYKLLLKGDDWAFVTDGMIFHPELTWSLKRLFLSECEGILRDEERCVGMTLVATATEAPLWKYGYVPFGSQALALRTLADLELSSQDLRGLRIELR